MQIMTFIITILLFFLSGCTSQFIDNGSALGKYEARYENGTHTLILQKDGKYIDNFQYKHGNRFTYQSFWHLEQNSKDLLSTKRIVLKDYLYLEPHGNFVGKPLERYEARFPIYQWFPPFGFGLIEIEIDPDGVDFFKVD